MSELKSRQCYHCKEWISEGTPHDCWTTTEGALTRDLPEDLRDAWERLRETAAEFGPQRIYASHNSIMFSRKACYFFVRPKKTALEVCVFLRRTVKHPRIRRTDRSSSTKVAHTIRISHRDEVEAPITDWLREAYESTDLAAPASPRKGESRSAKTGSQSAKRQPSARKTSTGRKR
jgi:Domain of unknown function (DUF5655)